MSSKADSHKKVSEKKKPIGEKDMYSLISPKSFGEIEVGMSPAKSPESLIGRIIEVTLSDITNDLAVVHIKLKFKVAEVVGNNAYTKFVGSDFTRDYLRSLVRRSSTRVDGIYVIETNDKYKLRITALVFSESRITRRQQFSIRKIMKEVLDERAKSMSYADFTKEIIYGKIATEIYLRSKKFVPVRKSEILKCKLLLEPAAS